MILAVDDDFLVLEHIRSTLEGAGWQVVTFDFAEDALTWARTNTPELVISDVRMPGMDGFEFRDAYQQIHPTEWTPFVFMSSMSDDETVVAGLESGADDYLIKPVSSPVLIAKVKMLLRKRNAAKRIFHGSLSNIPFNYVMRFCETKGLTGRVVVERGGETYNIEFQSGRPVQAASDALEKVLLLEEGTFTICSRPVDVSDIVRSNFVDSSDGAGEANDATSLATKSPVLSEPMGRLSQLKAGSRRFQIQTEITHHPTRAIVTLVTVDGRSVSKRSTPAHESFDHDTLEQLINHQHDEVEQDLRGRIEAAAKKRTETPNQAAEPSTAPPASSQTPAPVAEPETHESADGEPKKDAKVVAEEEKGETPEEAFERLFDKGFEFARDGELEKAIAVWEKATEIDPFNKTLQVNLEIIRKKLLKQQGKLDPFD